MQPLPIGIQTFADIRAGHFVYVDKTALIHELVRHKRFCFFARPRRFGKTLLVSTLEAIFTGRRELFDGLAIVGTDYPFDVYPVLRFDFSIIAHTSPEVLEKSILARLSRLATSLGLATSDEPEIETRFADLISAAAADRQVVILIDEYDKPIIEHLETPDVADENRKILRRFYSVIKALDAQIRFVFVTGITKFTKVSLFSELNNLQDLSLSMRFATLAGLTEDEIQVSLSAHLADFAEVAQKDVGDAMKDLEEMYNGYRFSTADATVYNPWSLFNALDEKRLEPYWYESGSPSFLIRLLRKTLQSPIPFDLEDLRDFQTSVRNPLAFDLHDLDLVTLLFQTGYLTIRAVSGAEDRLRYHLGFPNREVALAFLTSIAESLAKVRQPRDHIEALLDKLAEVDLEGFCMILRTRFFAHVPYELHIPQERYYQTLFHTIFLLLGLETRVEEHTNLGRMDQVVVLEDKVFIFEFKLGGTPAEALAQIKSKGYAEKFLGLGKAVTLVGISFEDRNIAGYASEALEP